MAPTAYTSTASVKSRMGIADATDDTLLGTLVTQVDAWLDGYFGRSVGPTTGGTAIFDGTGTPALSVPQGIRTITTLTMAEVTGGTPVSIPASDFWMEPLAQDRPPGWPAFTVRFKDVTTSGYSAFVGLRQNVTIVGDFGWAAVPDEVAAIAAKLVTGDFRSRAAVGGELFSVGVDGQRDYGYTISVEDRRTLSRYRRWPLAGVG